VDAWVVGAELVLVGCHRVRVLGRSVTNGRDVAAPDVSDEQCKPLVVGVTDGALVLAGSRAVDVHTGKTRSVTLPDGGADEIGGATYQSDDAGGWRLERRRRAGYDVWPVAQGKDSLFAYGPDGLVRAADPTTGQVVWEYGTGLEIRGEEPGVRPPVVWSASGGEVVAVRSRSATGHDRVLLFRHGASVAPPWTGVVRGRGKAGEALLEGHRVHAAGHTTLFDEKGEYSFTVSTRGTLLVGSDPCGDGCDVSTAAVDVDPRHGQYTVDLPVRFSQACH
jgi:hypothetical protein